MSATSERIRREFAASDAVRDAGLTTPDDIQRYVDIAYGSHPLQKLDVYRPPLQGRREASPLGQR